VANSTAILPKGKRLDMRKVIQNTLTAQAKAIKADFGVTVQTWDHKPKIAISTPSPYERAIVVEGDIYAMLNEGTRAHDIKPKRGGVLRFQGPFRAKTLPNEIASQGGQKGNVTVWSRGVHHPGTKARNWDRVIAKKWQERIGDIFQRAIDAAVH